MGNPYATHYPRNPNSKATYSPCKQPNIDPDTGKLFPLKRRVKRYRFLKPGAKGYLLCKAKLRRKEEQCEMIAIIKLGLCKYHKKNKAQPGSKLYKSLVKRKTTHGGFLGSKKQAKASKDLKLLLEKEKNLESL